MVGDEILAREFSVSEEELENLFKGKDDVESDISLGINVNFGSAPTPRPSAPLFWSSEPESQENEEKGKEEEEEEQQEIQISPHNFESFSPTTLVKPQGIKRSTDSAFHHKITEPLFSLQAPTKMVVPQFKALNGVSAFQPILPLNAFAHIGLSATEDNDKEPATEETNQKKAKKRGSKKPKVG